MFTGIVQACATVRAVEERQQFRHLTIAIASDYLQQLNIGASIAINGCCLTVTAVAGDQVEFDVIDETLRLTNLGQLKVGDAVNFERSLKMGDELGGHIVSGHIHVTASVLQQQSSEHIVTLWLSFPAALKPYIFSKGFITVNGASLTVGEVDDLSFALHLIPETLRLTNLDNLAPGVLLNLEVDQQTMTIVDTVERIMAQREQLAQ